MSIYIKSTSLSFDLFEPCTALNLLLATVSNQDSFFISPYTIEEIIQIILNFKPKKSAGPNSIPTKILRLLTGDIFEHLSVIFNTSFANGIFPEKLKVAKVIPSHK